MPLLTRTRPTTSPAPAAALPAAAALLLTLRLDAPAVPDQHPLLEIAAQLADQHREQWDAEDVSRRPDIGDGAVARAKTRIDDLNHRRAVFIDRIDAWCDQHLPAAAPDAPLHTETIGSVVDRLAIAVVRADRLNTDQAAMQLGQLAHAYGVLAGELAAGHRRVPSWRTLKAYGPRR